MPIVHLKAGEAQHALTAHELVLAHFLRWHHRALCESVDLMKEDMQRSALPHVELLLLNLDVKLAIPELLALLLKLLL